MKRAAIWSASLVVAAFLGIAFWPAPLEDPSLGPLSEPPTISDRFIDIAWDAIMVARQLCPSCAESLDRAEEQLSTLQDEVTPDVTPPDPMMAGQPVRHKSR